MAKEQSFALQQIELDRLTNNLISDLIYGTEDGTTDGDPRGIVDGIEFSGGNGERFILGTSRSLSDNSGGCGNNEVTLTNRKTGEQLGLQEFAVATRRAVQVGMIITSRGTRSLPLNRLSVEISVLNSSNPDDVEWVMDFTTEVHDPYGNLFQPDYPVIGLYKLIERDTLAIAGD